MVSTPRKIKLIYTLAGWIMILRHPIRNPRDYARAVDMLQGDIDRIRL
jgi:hypothetical protein